MRWGDACIYRPSFTSILLHLLHVFLWLLMFTQKDAHRKRAGEVRGRKEEGPACLLDVAEAVLRKYALPCVMKHVGGRWWFGEALRRGRYVAGERW